MAKITGTSGNDTLNGGPTGDQIFGLAGNDILNGGAGNDQLYGAEGDDLLKGGVASDMLVGGDGSDTASYDDAITGVTVSLALAGVQYTDGGGNDTLSGI
ncbi:MAG: repeat-containing protein, partial [Rhizorhabdus sp.]|nr:repeat-containing protein [Rhizorhabdus sp.]